MAHVLPILLSSFLTVPLETNYPVCLKIEIHELHEIHKIYKIHMPKYRNPPTMYEIHCPKIEIHKFHEIHSSDVG